MNKNNYVAIMAGGVGSRFYPSSRESRPKQFLDILGVGKSLLQLTYERFLQIVPAENIYIVTNEMYRPLVKEQLPNLTNEQILGEPSRNNTAPCVAYTAFKLFELNPAANFVVAPSDHVILKEHVFCQNIQQALDFTATNDALVTLGITPTRPDTGYGYINYNQQSGQNNIYKVNNFTEKPNLDRAKAFLASGEYLWNAGIFVWKAKNLLDAFQNYAADVYYLLEKGKKHYNTKSEQDFINEYYPQSPNISIDYAIMEKADNVYTIPADLGWSDLGTWASLFAESDKDDNGNVILNGKGNKREIMTYEVNNSLIRVPENKLVILRGLDDFIVVDEGDVLLVYPKSKEQDIKQASEAVKLLPNAKKFL